VCVCVWCGRRGRGVSEGRRGEVGEKVVLEGGAAHGPWPDVTKLTPLRVSKRGADRRKPAPAGARRMLAPRHPKLHALGAHSALHRLCPGDGQHASRSRGARRALRPPGESQEAPLAPPLAPHCAPTPQWPERRAPQAAIGQRRRSTPAHPRNAGQPHHGIHDARRHSGSQGLEECAGRRERKTARRLFSSSRGTATLGVRS